MVITPEGKLIEGDIPIEIQLKYDIRSEFNTNPIKNVSQLIDSIRLIDDDEVKLFLVAKEKVESLLKLNEYDLDFIVPLFDKSRAKLYKFYLTKFN